MFLLIILLSNCQSTLPSWMANIESNEEVPPAIILMIGDGMGLSQLSAAMYAQQEPLNLEAFPVIGFHKTHSADNLVSDSAAGATAFACGLKTYNSAIGVDTDTVACETILEQAQKRGLSTGMVVTSAITHATPASFAAHEVNRVYYEKIAIDISKAGVDLLIGGGKRYFDYRKDDRNLLKDMRLDGYEVRSFLDSDVQQLKPNFDKKLLFFTADKQPLPVSQGRDYLPYASRFAASFLHTKNPEKGFFLMIEASQIDWANHANEGRLMIQETQDFDKAIGQVLSFAKQRGNTLVIVTADHESGGCAIQKGSKRKRIKTEFTTNGHTAAMVPVYAYGPGAAAFSGIYENTELYHKMRAFLGFK